MMIKCGTGWFNPWAVGTVIIHRPYKGFGDDANVTHFTATVKVGGQSERVDFPNRKACTDGVRHFVNQCNKITESKPKKEIAK